MKRTLVFTLVVVIVAGMAWTAMAQRDGQQQPRRGGDAVGARAGGDRAQMRERWESMSEEERAKFREEMRQRWQGMSDEQRTQARGRFGGRGMSSEEQLKSIKAIETQLAKLKAIIEASSSPDRTNFRDMSEEDRAKLREKMTKQRETRMAAIAAIDTEVGKLRGPRPDAAAAQAAELTRIQSLAKEENAPKTARALQGLITRAQRPTPATPLRRPEGATRRGPAEGGRGTRRRPAAEGDATKN